MTDSSHDNSSIALRSPPPGIEPEALLELEGWFLLSDVFRVLEPQGEAKYKRAFKLAKRLTDRGADPFEIMGRRKIGGRVCVLMQRFAPWYRANPLMQLEPLPANLAFPDFLKMEGGLFRLSEVCNRYRRRLPVSYTFLKRKADSLANSRAAFGVFRYESAYLVTLPAFARWYHSLFV